MEITIRPTAKWKWFSFVELWQYRDLFYVLTWRDIKVRYKQTLIGVLWVILQPLMSTFIFTFFFGTFVKIPSGTMPYSVFVLIGLIFWGFFSAALSRSSNSLIENQQLVKKVYFPREILPFSTVVTAFIDFLVALVMFFIVALFYHISFNLAFLGMILLGIVITVLTSTGIGLLVASINIKYRDVRYIIPYFLQLMIFITPVIYPLSIVRPSFQFILALNPMAVVINSLRSTLVSGSVMDPTHLIVSLVASFVILIIGMLYFRKTERFFADLL